MAGQTIQISVLADTRQFSRAMRGLADQTGLSKLGGMAKNAAKAIGAITAATGAAGVALGAKAVSAASDLQQSIGGLEAVFKDSSGQMHEWAKGAAESVGLSRNSYNELATAIGTTLKNSGIPMDELGAKTNDLLGLSADLAATFGGPVTQASGAMASALRGEFEPLRAYGVSLNAAAIEARALADSGKASADSLTAQERALATQALIYEQTADAQGSFARESNTLAGQQERLKAKLENIAATAGTYLLPVLTTLVAWLSDRVGPAFEAIAAWVESTVVPALQQFAAWAGENLLPKLRELGEWVTGTLVPALQQFGAFLLTTVVPALMQAAQWVQQNSAWLLPLAIALGAAVVAYMAVQRAILIWKAALGAAKAAQLALNLAMTASPIGLVIALVVGLVAGLVALWTQNEDFRNAVTEIWNSIVELFKGAVEKVSRFFAGLGELPGKAARWFDEVRLKAVAKLLALVTWVKGLPGRIVTALISLPGRMTASANNSFGKFKTGAENKGKDLLAWVTGIPGRIVESLGNLGNLLLGAGRSVIDGFVGGLRNAFGSVRESLAELTSWLPDWKGPAERDAVILRDAGRLVIGGFVKGLESRYPNVRRALQRVTGMVADTSMPNLTAPAIEATGAGGVGRWAAGGGNTYHITLQTLTATPEAGRHIVDAIKAYERLNGPAR